ncbi:hypothetical protein GCM10010182_00410 [Actinomadura cremea]|nr:hypothetical protein GCM10010182_00410 [Actinomadura cremea]
MDEAAVPLPHIDYPSGFTPDVPSWPRVWNYWLGGKDNFPADRRYGDEVARIMPGIRHQARAHRYWVCRVLRFLAIEGIDQFLQVGGVFPQNEDDPEQITRRVRPGSQFVYADSDPLVLAHTRALKCYPPGNGCEVVNAPPEDADAIVAWAAMYLDFDRPAAVLLPGILHLLPGDIARDLVAALADAVAPGSWIALAHPAGLVAPREMRQAAARFEDCGGGTFTLRLPEEVANLLHGLELIPPGVVEVGAWRPDLNDRQHVPVDQVGALARP